MNFESLQILAKSDPRIFADAIEEYGVKIVGVRNTDPLEKRAQQESVEAMASVLTSDIHDNLNFTPLQNAIKTIAEANGMIVALCLECAMRKRANAKKRRK